MNEIRTLVPLNSWRHCRGKNNPADIPSRGMSPSELSECTLWIEGPTWLSDKADSGIEEFNIGQLPQECLEEMKAGNKENWICETSSSLLVGAETFGVANVVTCEDYSNLQRLLRVTALVLQFLKILKLRLQKNVEPQKELTSHDIAVAETLWIKEIPKSLSKNPKFESWKQQFGIFTDEHGIMRCMGRLSQAQLPASTKYPDLKEDHTWHLHHHHSQNSE